MMEDGSTFPKSRRSASADAALRAEIKRVEKMSIEERMRAALALGTTLPAVEDFARKTPAHGK